MTIIYEHKQGETNFVISEGVANRRIKWIRITNAYGTEIDFCIYPDEAKKIIKALSGDFNAV